MIKIKRILASILSLWITLTLSGCGSVLLNPKGQIAADEKSILITSVLLMLTIVIPVIILILFFAWRYREGNSKAAYRPTWEHNTLIEIVCWSIPCIIIAILGTITWITSHTLDPYKPLSTQTKPLTIQAISLEWRWLFIYPEQNIATIDFIQFPVGTPVQFVITAEGPMNSFQIPQLGGQIYAMAGMQAKLNLIANEPGEFQGVSANFTGEGFSDMKFFAKASTAAEFKKWVNTAKQSPDHLTVLTYNELAKPNKNNEIRYFSSVTENLFSDIVMKSMMPMTNLDS